MTKIDIFSGFLGAGKTTLIKKMISEAYQGEKIVLIENEFGEIGIDGGFLQEAGITINEMNSGCICCSLVGDFSQALQKVIVEYAPDRILIEPSGVGKLSDVVQAVKNSAADIELSSYITVADAGKCKMYMKNFGEFYNNQISTATTVILSRTDGMSEDKLHDCIERIRSLNETATIITTPWDQLTGEQIRAVMEQKDTLAAELSSMQEHTHHHHEDGHCCCGHDHHEHHEHHEHHHEDGHCCCGHEHHEHHEHHHEDGHCCCGHDHHEHHEHHHEDGHCCCGHDHHEHHEHHHHADEVFTSWGMETPKKFTRDEIHAILRAFDDNACGGMILRAKGIVQVEDGSWIHFDYVPGEHEVRSGCAAVTGRLCVIGSGMDEVVISKLFGV